eukprot:CAMPEP_0118659294 /NCGR_PEP_ID=MMETSP0785-20121206/15034_1 /TAXON_ID=91992 /ORGANISM="Bolidomonas pacifica, Strain CCMP 1866" /LENGTH=78 /DNA_ID=CAMNT_0006552387 /DNA_START=306 /DNA_END=539 /DNA_ORIENTATION=-
MRRNMRRLAKVTENGRGGGGKADSKSSNGSGSTSDALSSMLSTFPPAPPFVGVMSGLGRSETEVLRRGYGDLNKMIGL